MSVGGAGVQVHQQPATAAAGGRHDHPPPAGGAGVERHLCVRARVGAPEEPQGEAGSADGEAERGQGQAAPRGASIIGRNSSVF